jgi:hypothetical protein
MNLRGIAANPRSVDVAISAVTGYVAAKTVMDPVTVKLYEWEDPGARQREDALRPAQPYRIAAEKTTRLLGLALPDRLLDKLALGFHYGVAVSWAPLYALLRRSTKLGPVTAGVVTGASMALVVDEGLTPALGLSAPDRAYPLATHVRGIAGHLAFGLGVAALTETAWRLCRTAARS